MTAFYKGTDQAGQPRNTIYAEDIGQFVDVLNGIRDAGPLQLLQPLATPPVPTSVALSSGGITGTGYQWAVYWITGIQDGTVPAAGSSNIAGRTPYGTLSTAQALTAQKATVSISGLTVPTGAIGWGVARNKSGGSTWFTVPGSEQFLSAAGTMPNSFVDNVADASLVTAAPTTNTTGTTLNGGTLVRLADSGYIASAQASFDFQNITPLFSHLVLDLYARGSTAATSIGVVFRINNDSGAVYDYAYLGIQNGATLGGTVPGASGATSVSIAPIPAASNTDATSFGHHRIIIPNYAQAFANHVGEYDASAGAIDNQWNRYTGGWQYRPASPAAINRVTLTPSAGNFVANSRATLYGIL